MDSRSIYAGRKIRIVETAEEKEVEIASNVSCDNSEQLLITKIKGHLYYNSEKHLIGVFGKTSDIVVSQALTELERREDTVGIAMIPKSYALRDLPTLFALAIYSCLRNDARLKFLTEGKYMEEISSIFTWIFYNEEFGVGFNKDDATTMRARKCKELIEYINSYVDMKFVWNLEVPEHKRPKRLLYLVREMLSDNLIIILNYISTYEHNGYLLSAYYGRDEEFGLNMLKQYFKDNIVIAN